MKKRIAVVAVAALSVGSWFIGAGPASADHCTDTGAPGHSEYAEHVRVTNGSSIHNEGLHRGWSTCEDNSHNFGG